MKKFLCLFAMLSAILWGGILGTQETAMAETDSSGMWEYSGFGSGVAVTKYNGTQTDVFVPGSITAADGQTLSVVKLGDGIFKGNTVLNSVTLGAGITEIGASAFEGAANLVCIVTNEELTTIGANAFFGCSNFNSIILQDTVTSIGENAFANCPKLTIYCNAGNGGYTYATANAIPYVILNPDAEPEIVTFEGIAYYIMNGEAILMSYGNLPSRSIIIPAQVKGYPVTRINNSAFKNSSIVTISLPDTIIDIDERAFFECKSLQNIDLPTGISTINAYTFYNCNKLKNIKIPYGVESLATYAFYGCWQLSSIDIAESVKTIGDYTFMECLALNNIYIPNSVTFIGNCAFYSCISLESIKIPDSVINIGTSVFSDCDALKSVEFSQSITTIPRQMFFSCIALTNVSLPDNLTEIAANAFYGCSALQTIAIPDSVTSIGGGAFQYCKALQSIQLPNDLTILGSAFSGCSSLESINIPSKITSLAFGTFKNCSSLKSIVLPKALTKIGYEAFYGCSSLESITIPETVTTLESGVFHGCEGLKNVQLPTTLKKIGTYTFYGCTSLLSMDIPQSVTIMDDYAFNGCNRLEQIELPAAIEALGEYAFHGCTSLKSLYVPATIAEIGASAFSTSTTLKVYENSYPYLYAQYYNLPIEIVGFSDPIEFLSYTISNNQATVTDCLENALGELTIPDFINDVPVTAIGKSAFYGCKSITKVNIPDSVTNIGESAFSYCYALENICIPDGIKNLGYDTFYSCTALKDITLPNTLTSIDRYAFSSCSSLSNITLPEGLTFIGSNAFYGCKALKSITIPSGIESIEAYTFSGCENLKSVIFSNNLKTIGARAFNNCKALKSITLPDSVTAIGDAAFQYVPLETVALSANLKSIGINAFSNCSLTAITLPDTVSFLGDGAFSNCTNLKDIVLPPGLEAINANTFYRCLGLKSIKLPESLQIIGNGAFSGCWSLENATIPESVTEIGAEAFNACWALKNLVLPVNLESIGNNAFYNCYNAFTSIVIPEGISEIGDSAFFGCTSLERILLHKNITSIGSNNFLSCPSCILLVYNETEPLTYAKECNLPYFIIREYDNPEISYGAGIFGTVSYSGGTPAANVTVSILHDDGTVKETVVTDESGKYSFTYAEVGRYTIQATDTAGHAGTEVVSVKRMNAFDVFLSGETDIVLKAGWNISGTVSPSGSATVTLTDADGNTIATALTADGAFTLSGISNGTYILKAENETGSISKEITVFNGDITAEALTIAEVSASLTGYVEVEDRAFNHHRRNWVQVTVYNADGIAVAQGKTDKDGLYLFTGLPIGDYAIVAETAEMRPDKKRGFDRSHTLTGYAYISITEAKSYTAETIILYEENDHLATISGKVTAQGESQSCEVILTNVFRHEVAKYTTGNNGKYIFKNVRDGLYFVTAVTESRGMGFAVVAVRHGQVYGNTDIFIYKAQKIHDHEKKLRDEIPDCRTREEALTHKKAIAEEKRFYDGLSEKEKKQLSRDYIEKLSRLAELIAGCDTSADEGKIHQSGLTVSGDELESESTVKFILNVSKHDPHYIGDEGINSREDFMQQSIEDTAGSRELVQYYDISLSKDCGGTVSNITSVQRDTDTTGKFRITLDIPEAHRGHKHYSFVHMHNGVPQTLVDLDDNPNTVTFEIDRFSTFALTYTDEELTGQIASITPTADGTQISVSSEEAAMLYIATRISENKQSAVRVYKIAAGTSSTFDFGENQEAILLDSELRPLCNKFTISK